MLKKLFPVSISNLPFTIVLISFFYSVVNILMTHFGTAYNNNLSVFDFVGIFKLYSPLNFILICMSFLIGVGLIGVKRWAFFLYLIFNSILIIHGLYYLIKFWGVDTEILSTESLLSNMFLVLGSFGLTLYMLSAEISTPYLTLLPRGFRKKWRTEIPLKGVLEDTVGTKIEITTLDISPTGCLATASGFIIEEGAYTLTFDIEKPWTVQASVVRITEEGVGLRFNYTSKLDPSKRELKNFLESKLVPRYSITMPGHLEINSKKIEGEILNISEGGFYLTSTEKVSLGDLVSFRFKFFGIGYSGNGKVSWLNPTSLYHKNPGFGISFSNISKSFIFKIMIFFIRIFTHFENRDR